MTDLPTGWINASFADVTSPYETTDPARRPSASFTYVDISAIDNRTHTISEPKQILGRDAPSRARRVIAAGDVLFSTVRTYLKNIALVPIELDGSITSTGIAVLRPNQAVESGYLFNFVRSDRFINEISAAQDGTLYPAVSEKKIYSSKVPLAPLAEQKRILAKLNILTEAGMRAREELSRIPMLLAAYKSAVLELAFSGRLTADLRGDAPGKIGTIPPSWNVELLGNISEIQGGIQIGKKRNAETDLVEVPYLRVANVQRGWLNLDEVKSVLVTPEERDRLLLRNGDILMNEGGDRDKLGRGWVWKDQVRGCIHQNHVFRVRLKENILPPEFVSHFANERGQQYFLDQGTQTTNLASISKSKLARLPIPVPPLEEAVEIMRRVDTAFAWVERIEDEHLGASGLLPKLESSVLTTAFRGELVPQDHHEEPADVLLQRVRAEMNQSGFIARDNPQPGSMGDEQMASKLDLEQVLVDAGEWIDAQEAFKRCGVGDGSATEKIEEVYGQLRELHLSGRLESKAILDENGRKAHDQIRLKVITNAS